MQQRRELWLVKRPSSSCPQLRGTCPHREALCGRRHGGGDPTLGLGGWLCLGQGTEQGQLVSVSSGMIRFPQELCILNDLLPPVAFPMTQCSHTEFPVSPQFTSSIQETGPPSHRACPQQQHGGSLGRDRKQRTPSGGPALASAEGSGACRDPRSPPWPPPAHAAVSARSPGDTLHLPA